MQKGKGGEMGIGGGEFEGNWWRGVCGGRRGD
jgi:hypothetical protein